MKQISVVSPLKNSQTLEKTLAHLYIDTNSCPQKETETLPQQQQQVRTNDINLRLTTSATLLQPAAAWTQDSKRTKVRLISSFPPRLPPRLPAPPPPS